MLSSCSIRASHPYLRSYQYNSSTLSTVIDWRRVNDIVSLALDTIKNNFPSQATSFLDWYEQMEGSNLPVTDPIMVQWFKVGFSKMRGVTDAISSYKSLTLSQIQQIERSSGSSNQSKLQVLAPKYRQLSYLTELLNQLLGCQAELGQWFYRIYELLSTTYPNDSTLRNAYNYFTDQCLKVRQEML